MPSWIGASQAIRPDDVSYWCERAERLAVKFNSAVQESPTQFLNSIVSSYITSHQKDDIRDPILDITRLQKSIRHYQGKILQLSGAGKEWARSEEIASAVATIIKALEELLCFAMEGPNELLIVHQRCQLLYQL